MRNCEYILDAIYKLKEYEEDPATNRALRAGILAMIDEHLRHIGEEPLLKLGVIEQIDEDDSHSNEEGKPVANTCQPVKAWVIDASRELSQRAAVDVLERLNSPLLRHL